jgi:transketolase
MSFTVEASPLEAVYPDQGGKDTRSGFGVGLLELGQQHEDVVALCADLTGSLKMDAFQAAFPQRFFSAGIAEANMISVAAGMATAGLVPFTGTFANFSTGRVYDQIRQSVCYSGKNVKICASHAGLTLGEDGATHQILEDIGMMRMLPGMTVVVPCDHNQTRLATLAVYRHLGPVYLRFGRPKWPNFTPKEDPTFHIGRIQTLIEGTDVSILACGHLVWKALEAARKLHAQGISASVVNVHTIKPLDVEGILAEVDRTRCVVTAEEHMLNGGLGEAVAQVLGRYYPLPLEMVAVKDTFGESGTPDQLLTKYGLDTPDILAAVRKVLGRK